LAPEIGDGEFIPIEFYPFELLYFFENEDCLLVTFNGYVKIY